MKLDSLNTLKRLIADKEGGHVEFKKTTGQLWTWHQTDG